MRYTVLSFDLDGTLVDTAGEIADAANRTLADFNLPVQPTALITRLIGNGMHELMRKLLAQVLLEQPLRSAQWPVDAVLERFAAGWVRVPMIAEPSARSLNLSTCAGIAVYEALRQCALGPVPG